MERKWAASHREVEGKVGSIACGHGLRLVQHITAQAPRNLPLTSLIPLEPTLDGLTKTTEPEYQAMPFSTLHSEGNRFFKANDFEQAVRMYSRAIVAAEVGEAPRMS